MLNKLLDFYKNQMTEEQLQQATTLFNDDDKLLYFVVCSYNCYELLHSELRLEQMSLIANPEALFQTRDVQKAIIGAIKEFTFDRLDMIPMQEDERNAENTCNRGTHSWYKRSSLSHILRNTPTG